MGPQKGGSFESQPAPHQPASLKLHPGLASLAGGVGALENGAHTCLSTSQSLEKEEWLLVPSEEQSVYMRVHV